MLATAYHVRALAPNSAQGMWLAVGRSHELTGLSSRDAGTLATADACQDLGIPALLVMSR